MTFKNFATQRAFPVVALMAAGAANAAVDVSSLTTEIESNVASVTAIGGAVLLVLVAAAAFRWVALLHKARPRRHSPDPRRSYAIAIVSGVPSSVKRLSNATRTCSSVTWRSNVRAITRSPSRLKQCILVSTKLRRW